MTAPYLAYWGKSADGGSLHLAAFHCLDVAAVAEQWLLRDDPLHARLAHLTGQPASGVVPTAAFLCAMHDFGKFGAGFQMKDPAAALRLDPRRAGLPRDPYDHGHWGYHHLRDLEAEFALSPAHRGLWLAVTGHHGSFPSAHLPARHPAYRRVHTADEEARRAWLRDVHDLFSKRGAPILPDLPPSSMPLVELLAGLCSVSDWLGSQVDFFPFQPEPQPLETYYERALQRAERVIDATGICSGKPTGHRFRSLFPGYEPRGLQADLEGVAVPEGPCLVILEAETGSGKTEAALSLASRLLARGDASRLFFALPTMATSNAMLARIEDVAGRLFEGSVNLVLAHSRSRTHDAFERLVERPVDHREPPSEAEASITCARWFLSRKRVLLGQIGVGTVDQAMQAALRVRHHFVRAFALGGAVLVIDEVHAYDAYMEVILERLVEWLAALGAPVVLLSATLPAARRGSLAAAYRRGLGLPPEPLPTPSPSQAPYPLLTVVSRQAPTQLATRSTGASRRVGLRHVRTDAPPRDITPLLLEAAAGGAMVAWIRNTVREAQDAYRALVDAPRRLFHARFRPLDRAAIETVVLQNFGRTGGRRSGSILVATQVVEQSLDLDFDLLVTDLAPIDLLVQRVGRLHRHTRPRPRGFEAPQLILVSPTEADEERLAFGPSAWVYDQVTLWLALDSLRDRVALTLPEEVRQIVEDTYDPATRRARIAAAPIAGALLAAEEKLQADLQARRGRAASVCIPPTSVDPTAIPSFEDDEEGLRVLTREGDSVALILVAWDGSAARSVDGAAWPTDAPAWQLARDLAAETISVPAHPWERYLRGVPSSQADAWESAEARLKELLGALGARAVVVPVEAEGDGWTGRIETTRGVRTLTYHREYGLAMETPDA